MIKLIAVDLDGTLLYDYSTITKITQKAIEYALDRGVEFVPATGRMFNAIPKELKKNPRINYIITTNGSKVIDMHTNKAVYSSPVSMDNYRRLSSICARLGLYYELYVDGSSISPKENYLRIEQFGLPKRVVTIIKNRTTPIEDMEAYLLENSKEIEKFNLLHVPEDRYETAWKEFHEVDSVEVVSAIKTNMEINNIGTSKWTALKELCRLMNIAEDEVMAIGDSGNDVRMIEGAGVGVAMDNAYDIAKEAADFVTRSNKEDGVAHAIYRYVV